MTPSDAQRIEQLIQQLRKIAEWEHSYDAEHAIDEAVDLIEQQQREIERLRVDAARYQHIRGEHRDYAAQFWPVNYGHGELVDNRIDAVMAATAPMRAEKEDGRG